MAEKPEDQPATEEIEWTDEDDEIMNRVWAKLRERLDGKLPSQVEKEQEEQAK